MMLIRSAGGYHQNLSDPTDNIVISDIPGVSLMELCCIHQIYPEMAASKFLIP